MRASCARCGWKLRLLRLFASALRRVSRAPPAGPHDRDPPDAGTGVLIFLLESAFQAAAEVVMSKKTTQSSPQARPALGVRKPWETYRPDW